MAFYLLIISCIFQEFLIINHNINFLKIINIQKKMYFFFNFFTIVSDRISKYIFKKKFIYDIVVKNLKIFFQQFSVNVDNFNISLYFKSTRIIKCLNYYNHKPMQKFILKNIDFTINLLFSIKYIERFNKIKFIYIQKEKNYPKFILVRFRASNLGFIVINFLGTIRKKKVSFTKYSQQIK
ncbi:hypothetical protein M951_chr1144 (nucleomorph) [Lotharella oceanica]|uniref:Uncharacterized protein n=1 Tax=Lotharella oceanica TaxID=641309 RepID=A0A060DFL0_9EUKA|nr:hypothetical protein M951_chr1144 [Lotharella oceanica]